MSEEINYEAYLTIDEFKKESRTSKTIEREPNENRVRLCVELGNWFTIDLMKEVKDSITLEQKDKKYIALTVADAFFDWYRNNCRPEHLSELDATRTSFYALYSKNGNHRLVGI